MEEKNPQEYLESVKSKLEIIKKQRQQETLNKVQYILSILNQLYLSGQKNVYFY